MKLCYLVLAHAHADLLKREIAALVHPDVTIFVHIDAKSNIDDFREVFALPGVVRPKTHLKVAHGGYSAVMTYTGMLREALQSTEADYFVFLSGQCYPIRSNEQILAYYRGKYDETLGVYRNLVGFYELVPGANLYHAYARYYFRDLEQKYPKLRLGFRAVSKFWPRKRLPKDLKIFRGSFFSSLNRPSAAFVLDQMNSGYGRKVYRHLKRVFGPDEMFFQTMLLNSSYAEQCAGFEEYRDRGEFVRADDAHGHFIDWNLDRELPAVLEEGDYTDLISSDCIFFRKASLPRSAKLLDMIDAYRAG